MSETSHLQPLGSDLNVAVIGASGGIGSALVEAIAQDPAVSRIFAASRAPIVGGQSGVQTVEIDITDETSIESAARSCRSSRGLDLVLVATGILHAMPSWRPEKSWSEIDADNLARSFAVNCTGPVLVAKHFLPLLANRRKSVFAALTARVGSITDNRLGGWYGYRASKAALNMAIRTLAIELKHKRPLAVCIGLHPGTVATDLSAPFRARMPSDRVFSAAQAAPQLLAVAAAADVSQSGGVLAWDGQEIPP